MTVSIRQATPDDAAALVALRVLMFEAMGHPTVSNVVTTPEHRGLGLASGCLAMLIDWFRVSTDVRDINLSATSDGAALYRGLGFVQREYPSMRLRLE